MARSDPPALLTVYLERLAQFEGRKFCGVSEAARYLDVSETTVRELMDAQTIKSKYFGHSRRKVIVASLVEFAETRMSIDRPAPRNPS
jgi:excisionase family DNA binding protein